MAHLKVGDKVILFYDDNNPSNPLLGTKTIITKVRGGSTTANKYPYSITAGPDVCWGDHELKLVKETSMSKKFYRVIKDLPQWSEGAIVKLDDGGYVTISDLWNTEATDIAEKDDDTICIRAKVVENSPEYFERVYEVGVLGKTKYLAKEAARAAHNSLVKK